MGIRLEREEGEDPKRVTSLALHPIDVTEAEKTQQKWVKKWPAPRLDSDPSPPVTTDEFPYTMGSSLVIFSLETLL